MTDHAGSGLRNPDPSAYAFLYEQARATLQRQEAALDELRARSASLMAVAAVVAAFLAPPAFRDGLGLSGVLGVAAFAFGAVLCVAVLVPIHGWTFGNKLGVLFSDFVEKDPPLTMPDIHRELTIHHQGHIEANEGFLKHLYRAFRAASGAMIAEVVLLLFDIPIGG